MKTRRLSHMLDIMIAIALFRIVQELQIPYPRTLGGFWAYRRYFARPMASSLWLMALWLQLYDAWDAAERLTRAAALCGGAVLLCVLLTPYATNLILYYNRNLLFQELYGALMLLSAAVCFGLLYTLDSENRKRRRPLVAAFGIMAVGMALCIWGYRSAMWMSVAAAAVALIALRVIGWDGNE